MQEEYLGDSYDLVKRFWAENLRSIAPLYAHPRFVPESLRPRFTHLSKIKMFDPEDRPTGKFGLFLDPDTGIPFFNGSHGKDTGKRVSLPFIVEANKVYQPSYLICYDQSHHRTRVVGKSEQMKKKMEFLKAEGLQSFYYNSHAHFLFIAEQQETLAAIYERLTSLGVPPSRLKQL